MQHGQIFELKTTGPDGRRLWAYRYRIDGRGSRRIQRGGYLTADEARAALQQALTAAQRRKARIRVTLADLAEEYLAQHDGQTETTAKLRWLLTKSTAAFGSTLLAELDAREIAAWRMTLPAGHRFEATQALRQTLARAVEWGLIDTNPAKTGVDNPQPPRREVRPFDSDGQLEALAAELGPRCGPMVLFAAATGLRPGEWIALEHRDIDLDNRLVYVRGASSSRPFGSAALMTRIVCTADLHENLIDIPECDVLLIAGDVSFAFKGDLAAKQAFLVGEFREWLERVPATEVVLVAGNHDQSIQAWGLPDGLHCHYLEDSGAELFGLKLWGTPWQPWFHDWAFTAPRRHGEAFLASKFERIPAETDIVICHGPPRGYGDHNGQPDGQPHVGSTAMTEALERVQPRLMVCGHIHSGYGRYRLGVTEVVNAALVNNNYELVNPVVEITL